MVFWNLCNEACAIISAWTDGDNINGESSQVTFDEKSTFKFDSKIHAANNKAQRSRDDLYLPGNYSIEANLYFDSIDVDEGNSFLIQLFNNVVEIDISFRSDGLFIANPSFSEIGSDLVVEQQWQNWRFEIFGSIRSSAKCNVYLNKILVASNIACNGGDGTGVNALYLLQYGKGTVDNNITYLDYIKISSYRLRGTLPRFYSN